MVKAAGLQKYNVSGVRHPQTSLNPQTAPAPPQTSKRNLGRNLITKYTTNSIVERNVWGTAVVLEEEDGDDEEDEEEDVLSSISTPLLLVSLLLLLLSSSLLSVAVTVAVAVTGIVVAVVDMMVGVGREQQVV